MELVSIVVVGIVFLSTVVYMASGFGFALLAVPLLVVFIGPHFAVVAATILSLPLGIGIVLKDFRLVCWTPALLMMCASLPGFILGVLILTRLDPDLLNMLIGAAVLTFVWVHARELHVPINRVSLSLGGVLSGALATSTGMNGPPVVAIFHSIGLSPRSFRVCVAVVLFYSKVVALIAFGLSESLNARLLYSMLPLIPASALGFVVGEFFFVRTSAKHSRRLVLLLLAASGLAATVDGLLSFF